MNNNFREYDTFSVKAIEDDMPDTENRGGWYDYVEGISDNTPINADNLNAMLNMLIYIRNVVGKTDDFAKAINNVALYKSKVEGGKEVEDIESSVYPNPDNLDNRSIAKYLEAAFNAIIGTGDNTDNTDIDRTLAGLKKYLESLDVSSTSIEGDNTWVKTLSQSDGKITYTIKRPDADDIDVSRILIQNKATSKTYSNLTDALNDESLIRSTQISLEAGAREAGDNVLTLKLADEVKKLENADKANATAIIQEVADRKAAIQDLDSELSNTDASTTISKITITDGKLTSLATEEIKISTSQVTNLDDTLDNKLDKSIYAEYIKDKSLSDDELKEYTDTCIEKLYQPESGDDTQWVKDVSQTNGIIGAKYQTITATDVYNSTQNPINFENKTDVPEVNTIKDAFEKEAYLRKQATVVTSDSGLEQGATGLKLNDTYLKYLKKMTFATPSIASFNLTPSTTYLEVGEGFILTSISHYELNKDSIDGMLAFTRNNTTLKSNITPSDTSTTISISDSVKLVTDGSVTYTLLGYYKDSEDKTQKISSSRSINWYWPHFYGSSSNASLADVSGLNKSSITSSNFTGNLEISNNADEYVYFVTTDDSLTVKSGGFDVPLTISTLILNINGVSKPYNVYRTNQLNAGTLTYVLS